MDLSRCCWLFPAFSLWLDACPPIEFGGKLSARLGNRAAQNRRPDYRRDDDTTPSPISDVMLSCYHITGRTETEEPHWHRPRRPVARRVRTGHHLAAELRRLPPARLGGNPSVVRASPQSPNLRMGPDTDAHRMTRTPPPTDGSDADPHGPYPPDERALHESPWTCARFTLDDYAAVLDDTTPTEAERLRLLVHGLLRELHALSTVETSRRYTERWSRKTCQECWPVLNRQQFCPNGQIS